MNKAYLLLHSSLRFNKQIRGWYWSLPGKRAKEHKYVKLFLFCRRFWFAANGFYFSTIHASFPYSDFQLNAPVVLFLFIWFCSFFFNPCSFCCMRFSHMEKKKSVEPCQRKKKLSQKPRSNNQSCCIMWHFHLFIKITSWHSFFTQWLPALQATVTDKDAKHSNTGCYVVLSGGGTKKKVLPQ